MMILPPVQCKDGDREEEVEENESRLGNRHARGGRKSTTVNEAINVYLLWRRGNMWAFYYGSPGATGNLNATRVQSLGHSMSDHCLVAIWRLSRASHCRGSVVARPIQEQAACGLIHNRPEAIFGRVVDCGWWIRDPGQVASSQARHCSLSRSHDMARPLERGPHRRSVPAMHPPV